MLILSMGANGSLGAALDRFLLTNHYMKVREASCGHVMELSSIVGEPTRLRTVICVYGSCGDKIGALHLRDGLKMDGETRTVIK